MPMGGASKYRPFANRDLEIDKRDLEIAPAGELGSWAHGESQPV